MAVNKAFEWIIKQLELSNTPYLICGGLAANAYGSKRPLNDIDIFVPHENYSEIVKLGLSYISFGPARYRDECWDVEFVQFTYEEQKIEIGSDDRVRIFCSSTNSWMPLKLNFDSYSLIQLLGMEVRVMNKAELISYKKYLAREVDVADIKEIDIA